MIKIKYGEKTYESDNDGCISFDGNKIFYTKYANYNEETILMYIEHYNSIKFTSEDFSISLPNNRINSIIIDGDCFDLEWDKDRFVDGNGNGKNIIETEYISGTLEIFRGERNAL